MTDHKYCGEKPPKGVAFRPGQACIQIEGHKGDHRTWDLKWSNSPKETKRDLTAFTVLHPAPVAVPPRDLRPHCRACGVTRHEHGRDCHSNCQTCGGQEQVSGT